MGNIEKRPLTPKERKFLSLVIEGESLTDAYIAVSSPKRELTRPSAAELGSKMYSRIKKKRNFRKCWMRAVLISLRSLVNSLTSWMHGRSYTTRARKSEPTKTGSSRRGRWSSSLSFVVSGKARLILTSIAISLFASLSTFPTAAMVIEYERPWLADYQIDAIFNESRYSIIEASTKSGKTVGALAWLFEQALIDGIDGRNYWWVAPVFPQTEIAYRRLKRWAPDAYIKTNEGKYTITLANGAVVSFKSAERPDSLYGEDVHAAVIDEASRCKQDAWFAVRSTLTATRGKVRVIGNVKGRMNWAYRLGQKARRGDPGYSYHKITAWDAVEAGILAREEIEDARSTLPDWIFRELYLAEAADDEGRVYRNFEYAQNVRSDLEDTGGELLVGMDFNVAPMAAVVAVRAGDQIHIIDEITIRDSNTEGMANEIKRRYPGRKVAVYPDPTGRARKTSAPVGQTDFTILQKAGFRLRTPTGPYPVADKVNTVNAALKAADGTRRVFVSSSLSELPDAWERLYYKEGTREIDKSSGYDHLTDAAAYLICYEIPMVQKVARRVKVGLS